MIYLHQNQTNNVILTLGENTTLTGTCGSDFSYLFNFKSDDNQQNFYFTAANVSTNLNRYDQFYIIETGSSYVRLSAGTINLPTQGYYHYEIYQQTGTTNVHLSAVTGSAIEYGKVLVTGSTALNTITKEYTGATTLFVYQ